MWLAIAVLLAWVAPAYGETPSYTSYFDVVATKDASQVDYRTTVVVPAFLRGCPEAILARSLGGMEFEVFGQSLRQSAYDFLKEEYRLEGFGEPPEALEEEFRTLLRDSIVILISSPVDAQGNSTILGIVSFAVDRGFGIPAEIRLRERARRFHGIKRSETPRDSFVDFVFRTGVGSIDESVAESIILSARKWRIGGPLAVGEIKTLKIKRDLREFAKRLGVREFDIRSHILALMQNMLASHATVFSAQPIPPEEQIIRASPAEVSARLIQLMPKIDKLYGSDQKGKERLIRYIYKNAADPPPQPFVLLERLVIEAGAIDPLSQRDLGLEHIATFRKNFGFDEVIWVGPDPDVPPMTSSLLGSTQVNFNGGGFLSMRAPFMTPVQNALDLFPGPALVNPLETTLIPVWAGGIALSHLHYINPYHHIHLAPIDDIP